MGVMLVLGVTCGSSASLSALGKKTYEQRKKGIYLVENLEINLSQVVVEVKMLFI